MKPQQVYFYEEPNSDSGVLEPSNNAAGLGSRNCEKTEFDPHRSTRMNLVNPAQLSGQMIMGLVQESFPALIASCIQSNAFHGCICGVTACHIYSFPFPDAFVPSVIQWGRAPSEETRFSG